MAAIQVEWTMVPFRIPAKELLSRAEVCAALEIARDALKDLIESRLFPGPVVLGGQTKRWKREWVLGYLLRLEMDRWLLAAGESADNEPPTPRKQKT